MTSSIVEDADVLMQSQKSNLSSNLLLSKSVCDMLRGDLFVHITNIMNMTPHIEKQVIRGDYGFVYL
ncbi:hypothetical protein PSHT_02679, partial [Puccinia striiformis]